MLAGCGGGGTKHSRPAFESCLRDHSVVVIPNRPIPGQGVKELHTIAPNMVVGVFPDKEYGVFVFATDAKAASRVKDAIKRIRERNSATSKAKIEQVGNLVVVTNDKVTAVVDKTIGGCEKSAQVT